MPRGLAQGSGQGRRYEELADEVRALKQELDATRPISGAWNGDMTLGRQWGEQVCDMLVLHLAQDTKGLLCCLSLAPPPLCASLIVANWLSQYWNALC